MNLDSALIDFFSTNYSTYRETQDIWRKAGGNPARVIEEMPRTRWANLLQQVNAGAVDRNKLVLAALEDFPGSSVLLSDLAQHLPVDTREEVRKVVRALTETRLSSLEEANRASVPLQAIPVDVASAAVAVELNEAPDEQKEHAKSLMRLAKERAVETVVTEGTRVFLQVLPLLGPLISGTAA